MQQSSIFIISKYKIKFHLFSFTFSYTYTYELSEHFILFPKDIHFYMRKENVMINSRN